MSLASEDKPAAVIDLATLTGACMVALGDKIAGLMGNDDAWVAQVRGAADRAGEPVWHLPLPPEYRKQLESRGRRHEEHRRQLRRRAHRRAVPPGVRRRRAVGAPRHRRARARANADDGYLTKGGTGFGVRTLVELARAFEPPAAVPANGSEGSEGGEGAARGNGRRRQ